MKHVLRQRHLHHLNLDGRVISDFERDRLHREVTLTQGQLNTRREYDRAGRLLSRLRRHAREPLQLPAPAQTRFDWEGLKLLQEHCHGCSSLYVYSGEGSYDPLARVDGVGPEARILYYHNDLNGLPEQLTDDDGHTVWRAKYQVWGNALRRSASRTKLKSRTCGFRGSTWIVKRSCTTTRFGFMFRMWGGLFRRIRLDCWVGLICINMDLTP